MSGLLSLTTGEGVVSYFHKPNIELHEVEENWTGSDSSEATQPCQSTAEDREIDLR